MQWGEGPPTVIHWRNNLTGRRYCTRVLVHHCYSLRAADVVSAVRGVGEHLPNLQGIAVAQLAGLIVLDWQPLVGQVKVTLSERPRELQAEVRVTLDVTGTGVGAKGARLWLTCPRCSRRCGALYASPWNAQGLKVPGVVVTGCGVCLGLTDASRQRHRCLDWAGAVLGELLHGEKVPDPYRRRGEQTLERASKVFNGSFTRFFKGLGVPVPKE